jgi:hypothetical protein
MPHQSRLQTLPFEIRALIHFYAKTPTALTVPCCIPFGTPPTPPPSTRRCILPFSTIAATIDPLGVAYHSPKLAQEAVFVFCSMGCLGDALRIASQAQRGLILGVGAMITVALGRGDVDWILEEGEVPMSMVEKRPVRGVRWRSEFQGWGIGGEERVFAVMEEMFGAMARVGKKYNKGEGSMRFWWNRKEGGAGGVELNLRDEPVR